MRISDWSSDVCSSDLVVVVSGLGILAAPWVARLFLAFADPTESDWVPLTAEMLRITFPYLTFISMTALAGAVLNSFRQFGLPALTPVLHNLTLIGAMLLLPRFLGVEEKALAWGVLIAGILQMLVLWPAMGRLGLRPKFRFNLRHPGVRRVMTLMLPTIFRPEERREGKECISTSRSRWSTYNKKKKKT